MNEEKQGRIEFTLPMSKKSAYVRAARAQGMKLVPWMLQSLDQSAKISSANTQTLWDSFVQQAHAGQYEYADDAKALERVESEAVRRRILVERAIIRQFLKDVLAVKFSTDSGQEYPAYSVSVYYGDDEYGIEKSQDLTAIMQEVGACDEEYLNLFVLDHTGKPIKRAGWVLLVYGNSGWDVIADYSASPEMVALVEGTNDLTDEFEICMRSFDS